MLLCIVMCFSASVTLTGCATGNSGTDAFVIMTESLDGLFNPFFSTSANDGTIVAMTQIGMLSSKLNEDGEVDVAFGENEATVTLDFEQSELNENNETVYTFVIKNGIKYSDGHPLTMEDVLFNFYVYLDPVYTGSATIYSTDIKGLAAYRNQSLGADSDNNSEDTINQTAASRASQRVMTLVQLYWDTNKKFNGSSASTNNVTYAQMVEAIKAYNIQADLGYLSAVATSDKHSEITYQNLLNDYELALKYFREELESDFKNAKDAYTESPYKEHDEFKNEVFCFMFAEGFITPEYEKIPGTNKDDKSKIKSFVYNYNHEAITTKEAAIEKVYNDTVTQSLDAILLYWATASKLNTEFTAKAKEVILRESAIGGLIVPNIEGIVSLGHTTATEKVTVNGTEYKVAHDHDENGAPVNADEYDVLQITINGVDPKAVWNFAFSVAPQHYYGKGSAVGVDIANNQFGVEFSSFDYMRDVLQTPDNNKLPMGAGAYKVTDRSGSDNPDRNDFFSNNIVYFKANTYFETVGEGITNPKIEKVRYQVISASNAIAALEEGSVHYITPQYSKDNYTKIAELEKRNFESLLTDQLGYGYIGINASKITNLNIRKAIMCAMNTTLALDYYASGTASQIYWPMSKVSWAYPKGPGDNITNDKDYPQPGGTFNVADAEAAIQSYMQAAGVSAGHPDLSVTFTIAGSNLNDHPTYKTFRDAAELLNKLGWDVSVEPDTQALTKLATGSLEVWAAAWGSTIDPDLYQVYHKNSTATSTLAWGYPHIKAAGSEEEKSILNNLSDKIEAARETTDRTTRSALYKEAMSLILDLAIELPVYQRSTVYVYNTNVINPDTVPDVVNPYSSPLDRIWELEFNENAFAGTSTVDVGLVFAIIVATLAIISLAYTVIYINKKKNEKSPMLAYAVTLSDIESGNVRFPGQPKEKKHKKSQVPTQDVPEEKGENEDLTEKGEEEC